MGSLVRRVGVVLVVLLTPITVFAQGSIAGVVKDTSGAVLPGVTVAASSPALTEKVRSVVTDGTGQYRIVDLNSGTYAVTFTLPGFNTVKREGIILSGTFTATVDAQLRVGALQETVTVTGEAPVVDVKNAVKSTVIKGDVLEALPTSRSYNNVLQMVPGIVGSTQAQLEPTMVLFSAHGGNAQEGRLMVDGVGVGASTGGAGVSTYLPDMMNAEEVTFNISGNLGSSETGGPEMNVVPKSGGNDLSGSFVYSFFNQHMQGDNFDAKQRSVLKSPTTSISFKDLQGGIGGPIKRDKLWFFFNTRRIVTADAHPGIFANQNAGDPTKWTYVPDFSRESRLDDRRETFGLRLTAQLTQKHKVSAFVDAQPGCNGPKYTDGGCGAGKRPFADAGFVQGGSQLNGFFGAGPNSPETGDRQDVYRNVQQAHYTGTLTDKLLAEAAFGTNIDKWGYDEPPGNPTAGFIRVQEQSPQIFDASGNPVTASCADCVTIGGNLKYRSANWPQGKTFAYRWWGDINYVTGAQNLKIGYQGGHNHDKRNNFNTISDPSRLMYIFNNRVPVSIVEDLGPFQKRFDSDWYAFYAQEDWTINRLTVQGALRYDHGGSSFPDQVIPVARFVPTQVDIAPAKGVNAYNDLSPRVNAAYDLFGNGKTSLKFNFGKFLEPVSNAGRYFSGNPSDRIVSQTSRSWIDANHNYVADCDLTNPGTQDSRGSGGDFCGSLANQNFGSAQPSTTLDPSILSGWGVRPNDWDWGVAVQQQLVQRVSAEVNYIHRKWNSYTGTDVTDNVLVSASDFNSFSVTAPSNSLLPGGGGYTVSGLYNITPAKFGLSENVVNKVEKYGDFTRYYDGVDLTVQGRLWNGFTLQGGTSTGRTVQDVCAARQQVPEMTSGGVGLTNPYCRDAEPFRTSFKGLVSYLVPKVDVQVSGVFSSLPGSSLAANVIYTNAAVEASLGRPLAGGARTVVVNVLAPETVFGDRVNELDLRLSKLIRFSKTRAHFDVDLVNALNGNATIGYSTFLSPTWPTPTTVLTPRTIRVSAGFDF